MPQNHAEGSKKKNKLTNSHFQQKGKRTGKWWKVFLIKVITFIQMVKRIARLAFYSSLWAAKRYRNIFQISMKFDKLGDKKWFRCSFVIRLRLWILKCWWHWMTLGGKVKLEGIREKRVSWHGFEFHDIKFVMIYCIS